MNRLARTLRYFLASTTCSVQYAGRVIHHRSYNLRDAIEWVRCYPHGTSYRITCAGSLICAGTR